MTRMQRGDVAVIGLGCFGRSVALALRQREHSVIGIDRDPAAVDRLAGDLDHLAVIDATNEAGLREMGIRDFETVVVAIRRDFESSGAQREQGAAPQGYPSAIRQLWSRFTHT